MVHRDSEPLVSIGMPVYNGEPYLRHALDSLLAQDYPQIELIVSDNASTDRTPEILTEYAARVPRMTLHRHERNTGIMANFRFVFEQAQGDYFMWAAADDMWRPGFVSALVKELDEHPEAGVAMTAVELIDAHGSGLRTVRFDGDADPNRLDHLGLLRAVTARGPQKTKLNFFIYGLLRRRLVLGALKSQPNVFSGDRVFVAHLALATRFRYVDLPLYVRRIHEQSTYERHPTEAFSRDPSSSITERLRPVLALGWMLLRSGIVPLHRKRFVPLAMWRYALLMGNVARYMKASRAPTADEAR